MRTYLGEKSSADNQERASPCLHERAVKDCSASVATESQPNTKCETPQEFYSQRSTREALKLLRNLMYVERGNGDRTKKQNKKEEIRRISTLIINKAIKSSERRCLKTSPLFFRSVIPKCDSTGYLATSSIMNASRLSPSRISLNFSMPTPHS